MAQQDGISYDLTRLKIIPRLIREIERKGSKVEKPLKRWGTYMLAQEGFLFRHGWRGPVQEYTNPNHPYPYQFTITCNLTRLAPFEK